LSPRRVRILVFLSIPLILSAVYCWFFGFQTATVLMLRYKLRGLPDAQKKPVPLADLSVSPQAHEKASNFGYEYELPWDDVDEQKSKTTGTIRLTAFRSGNAFWFSCFPPKNFVNVFMAETKLDPTSFRQVYGEEAASSDYGFHASMLRLTPSDLSPFMLRPEAARDATLLVVKAIAIPPAKSGIFSIQTGYFRGFQFEDPRTHPKRVSDELYAEDGGIDVIFFQKQNGTGPFITQPEINRILGSIRRVD